MINNIHDDVIIRVTSLCDLVPGELILYNSVWANHIMPDHPEVPTQLGGIDAALNLVKMTLYMPEQVAESKPGPDNKNIGNYVGAFNFRSEHHCLVFRFRRPGWQAVW